VVKFIKISSTVHPRRTGPYVAGGAVRHFLLDEPIEDYDIDYFFTSPTQFNRACQHMESLTSHREIKEGHITYKIQKARMPKIPTQMNLEEPVKDIHIQQFTLKVQLIRNTYYSLEQLLDTFDFTICQTGWDGRNFWLTMEAYKDLMNQSLNLNETSPLPNPMSTWNRIIKYVLQGYTPSEPFYDELIEKITTSHLHSQIES